MSFGRLSIPIREGSNETIEAAVYDVDELTGEETPENLLNYASVYFQASIARGTGWESLGNWQASVDPAQTHIARYTLTDADTDLIGAGRGRLRYYLVLQRSGADDIRAPSPQYEAIVA